MALPRCLIVILAIILSASVHEAVSSLSAYDEMQCLFHSSPDNPTKCLLGGKRTTCGVYKCHKTIAESCSHGHEAKLTGEECGKSLTCGCDKLCNGCMNVNGQEKCHWAKCMPIGKRNQIEPYFVEPQHERSVDYPIDDLTVD